jgi:flagellar motor switch protein FliN/FliY
MTALQSETKSGELAVSPQGHGSARRDLPWVRRVEEHPLWPVLSQVPERTVAYIPLSHFTVHHLLTLEKGRVFTSNVLTSDLVPMRIGSVKLVWGEFETVNHRLALRITELA